MVIELNVNGRRHRVDVDSDETLLSVLREALSLTGSKYGCGEGQCGACTVLLDGRAVRSCQTPVVKATSAQITTVLSVPPNRKRGIARDMRQASSSRAETAPANR